MELTALAAAILAITPGLRHSDARTLSPNGRTVALVHKLGQASDAGTVRTEVVLVDTKTGKQTPILRPNEVESPNGFKFESAESLTFSADSKWLYVEAACPCDSGQIYKIDLVTKHTSFFAWGTGVSVLRNGPWRGYLLIGVHTCYAGHPGCDYPVHLVRSDGKTMLVVPNTGGTHRQQALARWLKTHGWRAS